MISGSLDELKIRIPEETSDALLESYLNQAEFYLREKRNYADDTIATETRWKYIIIELAESLYNFNGANGESSHTEGGISRTFRTKDEILLGVSSIARAV